MDNQDDHKRDPSIELLPYDDETINGRFTRDTLKAALGPAIPQISRELENNPGYTLLTEFSSDGAFDQAGPSRKALQASEPTALESKKEPKKTMATLPDEHHTDATRAYRSRLRSSQKLQIGG